jgi:molybdate transport system substrate-binding protein
MSRYVKVTGFVLVCMVVLLAGCGRHNENAERTRSRPLRVAAASGLAFALEEIKVLHHKLHQREVDVILGSSGLLARQIAQGAPFDLFFSANESLVDGLIEAGALRGDTKYLYAVGRIVIWQRADAGHRVVSLSDLRSPHIRKIAIANPDHAPYGLAARQALQQIGVWDELESRIVYGENVNQAHQFIRSGNADVGIIALSLGITAGDGQWTLVDDGLHAPIVQAAAVTHVSEDPDGAMFFLQTMQTEEGRAIMKRFGFLLPGDVSAGEFE